MTIIPELPASAAKAGRGARGRFAKAGAAEVIGAVVPPTATALATIAALPRVAAPLATAPAPLQPTPEHSAEAPVEAAIDDPAPPATPAEAPIPVAAAPAPIIPQPVTPVEGSTAMATIESAAAPTAEKIQSMFGDYTARLQALMERNGKAGEELAELARGNVEAVVASARAAAKGGEAIGQEAADYGRKSLESMMAMFKSYAAVKSPTELFQLQSDFARASFDSAVAEASKLSESMVKLAGEVVQPLSSRYAVAADKLKANSL